ncbi:ABC transporter permease [Flavobacterium sp.]|uniref:ABC transporter permease n=1 Tax=Flavobacterium sp. TaxID=239 RepID=UPI0035ADB6C2
MNFSYYIAKRYFFSKSTNNAINIISKIASVGIIAGTLALFVVLSVFSGLREFSLSFSNDFDPDLKIIPSIGKTVLINQNQINQIDKVDGILDYSKIIEERVLFFFDGKEQVAYIKGVDRNFTKTNVVSKKLFNGKWLTKDTAEVVIGYGVSEKLSLGLFDFNNPFEVYVPRKGKGLVESEAEAFNKAVLFPVGIYAISEELDSKYVFCDFKLAQQLLEYKKNELSAIEIKLKPNSDENLIAQKLKVIFGKTAKIKTRAELNDTLYKMLNTENVAVYLIFTLVIIIALFNLIGALIMMILDKKSNLKTMLSLGADIKDIRKVFLLQGVMMSVIGGIIGLFLGIIIVLLQQKFELIMITQNLAYPVVFSVKNVFIVLLTITTLGFIASFIASSRVTKNIVN